MRPPARGAGRARCASTAPTRPGPAPGVLDAIADGRRGGDRPVQPDRVDRAGAGRARRARRGRRPAGTDVVAVSPIVAGAALEGPGRPPAARARPRVVGRRAWPGSTPSWPRTLVIDEADADLAAAVEAEGMRCVVAPTIMSSPAARRRAGPHRARPPERADEPARDLRGRGHRRDPPRATTWPASSPTRPRPATAPRWPTATSWWSPRRSCRRPRTGWWPSTPTIRCSHKPLVERESVRILRRRGDLIISETSHGFVCANAGIDLSNVERGLRRAAARGQRPLGPAHPRRPPGAGRRRGGRDRERHVRAHLAPGRHRRGHRLAPASPPCVDLRGTHRRPRPRDAGHRGGGRRRDRRAPPSWSWARPAASRSPSCAASTPTWFRDRQRRTTRSSATPPRTSSASASLGPAAISFERHEQRDRRSLRSARGAPHAGRGVRRIRLAARDALRGLGRR